jgi:hypothetical protein
MYRYIMTLESLKPKQNWKLPKGIMKYAGKLSPESAKALRKFEKETDRAYESP